ncbi:MAG: HAD family hydrolase [Clostridia bacterium]|nr:HAD family hydrolase [Clostridia bacterium]
MKTKVILFDLDGTLLPMDQDVFIKTYFGALYKSLAPLGYEKERFTKAMWSGIGAMMKNNGEQTNEAVFWEKFYAVCGRESEAHLPYFEKFYEEKFDSVLDVCGFNEEVAESIEKIRAMGFRIALATQPVFPAIATKKRILHAGLTPDDFELYTTYENSSFCKPQLEYYGEIAQKLGIRPEECVMVGNDADEDMVAAELGMKVFLLTDNLINKNGKDISAYPQGSFTELLKFIANL